MLRGILATAVLLLVLLALWVITDGDARPDIPGFGLAEVTGHDLAELDRTGGEIPTTGDDDGPSGADDLRSAGLRIHVRARDLAGEPIAGAEVDVVPAPDGEASAWSTDEPDLTDLHVARTDSNGRASVTVTHSGAWVARIRAAGHAGAARHVDLRLGAVRPAIEFLLEPGQEVAGRVVDGAGEPVQGARLTAARLDDPAQPLGQLDTGPTGEFRFQGLPRADVLLTGARPGDAPARLAAVRVPNVARIELALPEPAVVEGVVRAGEGSGVVADARVSIRTEEPFPRVFATRTDVRGHFRIGGIPAGTAVRAGADAPGYAAGSPAAAEEALVLESGRTHRIDVRLWPAPGSVAGFARDLSRRPLVDLPLQLLGRSVVGNVVRRTALTSSTGSYGFAGVPDGTYVVHEARFRQGRASVFRSGLPTPPPEHDDLGVDDFLRRAARASATVVVAAGVEERHDVLFQTGVEVSGRVRSPDGRPVEGALVRVLGGPTASTDRRGHFRLRGVRPGPVRIMATHLDFSPAGPVELDTTRSGVAPPLDLRLMARLAGVFTDAQDRPVRGVRIALVWDDDPLPADPQRVLLPSAAGGYDRPIAVRGRSVRVRVSAPGHAPVERGPIAVRPGGVVALDTVRLLPLGVHGGRLQDESGAGVSGGRLVAAVGAREVVVAVSGADGTFEVPAVPGSRPDFVARAPGFLARPVTGLRSDHVPTFGLVRAHELVGRVVDRRDRPVPGMLLTLAPDERAGPAAATARTRTGSDGSFHFRGLPRGAFVLTGEPLRSTPRADGDFLRLPPTEVDVPTGSATVRAADTASVRGVVRGPGGGPLAGVPVTGTRGADRVTTRTRPDGSYELPGVASGGTWTLAAGTWGTAQAPVPVDGVVAGAQGVDLRVGPGLTLTVRCLDAAGQVLPLDTDSEIVVTSAPVGARVVAAGGGVATRVAGLPPGSLTVEVRPGERLADTVRGGSATVRLPREEPVEVRLGAAAVIGGHVRDVDGAPLPGAQVRAVPLGATLTLGAPPAGSAAAESDSTGAFRLTGLAPDGLFAIVVTGGPGFGVRVEEPVRAGTDDLAVVVVPGRLVAGTLCDAAGRPVPDATVAVLRDARTLVSWGATDAAGAFHLHGVPAGALHVVVRRAAAPARDLDLGPLAADATSLELTLPE